MGLKNAGKRHGVGPQDAASINLLPKIHTNMTPETIGIIVATYGDREKWNRHAETAVRSATIQNRQPDELIRIHRDTLSGARNDGAELLRTDWIVFLDADDILEPEYCRAIMAGQGEMRYPMVRYQAAGVTELWPARELNQKPLFSGNYMVIGTAMRREVFLQVGGFKDYPVYEDWELFCRYRMACSTAPVLHRNAIYRATVRMDSRNRVHPDEAAGWFQKIIADLTPSMIANKINLFTTI